MSHNKKNSIKVIEDMLESDDELPDSCNEYPETPSYINDERFDKLRFDWIYDKKMPLNTSCAPKNVINTFEGSERKLDAPKNINHEMPRKRVLKKNDMYCLQSVQNHLSGNVLIWFADFLMSKDMQSKYKFNKGCLVYEYAFNEFKPQGHKTVNIESKSKSSCKIF